jgi:pyrimidine operon attenuation protein/uracil phosphoribosyltransferase
MNPDEEYLCGAEEIERLILGMAREIWNGRRPNTPIFLVGVRTRGVPLAQRLAQEIGRFSSEEVVVGALDITLYRDDLADARHWPVLLGTEIPFRVDDAEIVLVDDVLFTGRTTRAAIDAVCDLGRPARIRLAVLVDRGHRELPIQPDVVGMKLTSGLSDRVRVRLQPQDPVEEIVRIVSEPRLSQPDRSRAT